MLGSLAASTATICVLSLSSPAVSAEGGFFDLPLTQAQCCYTANFRDIIAIGAGHPFLMLGTEADPAAGADNPSLEGGRIYAASGQGIGEPVIVRGNVNRGSGSAVDMTVAAGTAPADPGAAAKDAPIEDNSSEKPEAAEADASGGEFSGSPQPAGPDLTATQEKDLISSGWK
jgi:hypothetical protein